MKDFGRLSTDDAIRQRTARLQAKERAKNARAEENRAAREREAREAVREDRRGEGQGHLNQEGEDGVKDFAKDFGPWLLVFLGLAAIPVFMVLVLNGAAKAGAPAGVLLLLALVLGVLFKRRTPWR